MLTLGAALGFCLIVWPPRNLFGWQFVGGLLIVVAALHTGAFN